MTKIFTTLSAGLLMAGSAQAITVALDFAAAGNYLDPAATVVTTTETIGTTGSFDINYTLGATGNGTNPYASSTGTTGVYGVGSDADAQDTTLEGNDGQGISFYNLSIDNFVAGDSGYVLADIADLTFYSVSMGSAGNAQDGMTVSFDGFGTNTALANPNLQTFPASTTGTIFIANQTNFDTTETNLYLQTDNTSAKNRWSVENIVVFYNIPEPSSSAMLLGGVGALVLLRRRK